MVQSVAASAICSDRADDEIAFLLKPPEPRRSRSGVA
jgi:hypothetical protein